MAKGSLLLQPVLQFFDNSGLPLSGGKLYFYVTTTTTPKNTYTDSTKAVSNANPVILDSAGRPDSSGTPINIFLDGAYKLVVKTSADVTIRTVDPVNTLGQLINTRATSSSETIVDSDRDKLILVDASAGAKTITLLAAATCGDGYNVKIKKIDSSANAVIIDGNASETIDGSTTLTLSKQNDAVSLICDGTSWYTDQNGSFSGNVTIAGTLAVTGATSLTGALNLVGTSSSVGSMKFYEDTDNGTNYIGLQAPASIASDLAWILPSAAGSAGTFMKFDGTNTLSWSTNKPITSVVRRIFTSTGTYTPTAGMVYCLAELVGGGGAGGGAAGAASTNSAGAGGGSGAYGALMYTAASIGASQSVTIGAAGAAGAAGNTPGGGGGNTLLGALQQSNGGSGGNGQASGGIAIDVAGGAGGTNATATDTVYLSVPGEDGDSGPCRGAITFAVSGKGGNSKFGTGGRSVVAVNTAGIAGNGYGAGGSGGYATSSSVAGGAGTAGLIIITEYIAGG